MRQTQKIIQKKKNIIMSLSIKLINDEEHFVIFISIYDIFIQDNGVSPEIPYIYIKQNIMKFPLYLKKVSNHD